MGTENKPGESRAAIRGERVSSAPEDLAASAEETIVRVANDVQWQINEFARETFRTQGGRVGSGLGLVFEALWCFYTRRGVVDSGFDLVWLADHGYNDYLCVWNGGAAQPGTGMAELLGIEAKSMNLGADEAKGHFDQPIAQLGDHDLLLVLVWRWTQDGDANWPALEDYFIGNAKRVALLRDALHEARGGYFIRAGECPDGCPDPDCPHVGEPINSAHIRERRQGPVSRRGNNVSFAANFGGLVRMLKTSNLEAKETLQRIRSEDDVAHAYITFVHRNSSNEESNAYSTAQWRQLYVDILGDSPARLSRIEIVHALNEAGVDYRPELRARFKGH